MILMKIVQIPGINAPGRPRGSELGCVKILSCLREEIYGKEQSNGTDIFEVEDIEGFDNGDIEKSERAIIKKSQEVFTHNERVIFLGGDHSISYGCVKGFLKNFPDGRLIVFDAHPDCMSYLKEASHDSWLRKLVDDGFPGKQILIVGLRNAHPKESKFLEAHKIRRIEMSQLILDLEGTTDAIMEFSERKPLYVSLDIDVVDPAFTPGTGYKEPGGLSSRDIIHIIQRISMIKNLKGVDLVEINPLLDGDPGIGRENEYFGTTVKLGARIVAELLT